MLTLGPERTRKGFDQLPASDGFQCFTAVGRNIETHPTHANRGVKDAWDLDDIETAGRRIPCRWRALRRRPQGCNRLPFASCCRVNASVQFARVSFALAGSCHSRQSLGPRGPSSRARVPQCEGRMVPLRRRGQAQMGKQLQRPATAGGAAGAGAVLLPAAVLACTTAFAEVAEVEFEGNRGSLAALPGAITFDAAAPSPLATTTGEAAALGPFGACALRGGGSPGTGSGCAPTRAAARGPPPPPGSRAGSIR